MATPNPINRGQTTPDEAPISRKAPLARKAVSASDASSSQPVIPLRTQVSHRGPSRSQAESSRPSERESSLNAPIPTTVVSRGLETERDAAGPETSSVQHRTNGHISTDQAQRRGAAPKEWISWKLKNWTLISLILLTVAIVVAIAVLDALSRKHSGFVTVSDNLNTFTSVFGGKGLLWTSVPTLFFTIYRMAFEAVVSACRDRQPYVELKQQHPPGVSANVSILLDYRSEFSLTQWLVAFRNSHFLLGACFLLSLIFGLGAHSLSAHLFTANAVILSSPVSIPVLTDFNSSSGFVATTDLRPTMDTVAATTLYGGKPPAWTTSSYSFTQLSTSDLQNGQTGLVNLSVPTTAYSASLDCAVIPQSQYSANLTQERSTAGSIIFSATDRGCQLHETLPISVGTTLYLRTHVNLDCNFDVGWSRIITFGALLPGNNFTWPSNFSAISCIPSYWSTKGTLDVTLGATSYPLIRSFSPDSNGTDDRPDFWRLFENALSQIVTIDNTAQTSVTDFGRIIYKLSEASNPQTYMDGALLANATQTAFAAVWAMLGTTVLAQPAQTPSNVTGILSSLSTRLFVVSQVAYSIMAVLCIIAFLMMWMTLFVHMHPSILYEEPKGLLGQAGVLCASDVYNEALEIRKDPGYDGKMRKVMEVGTWGQKLENARFRFVDWETPSKSRIVWERLR